MAQFVRQGGDLVKGTIEVAQDAALAYARHVHAEGSAALAIALFGIDPVMFKGMAGKGFKIRAEAAEVLEDEGFGLLKGVIGLARTNRGEQIPPGQFLFTQVFRLGLPVLAEHGEGIHHGAEHGIQRFAVNVRHIDGTMQGILATAVLVEGVDLALDAVHGSCQAFFHGCPQLVLRFVTASAHTLIRVRAQVDESRGGQLLHLAVQLEIYAQLRGDGTLQLAPGIGSAQAQLSSQFFLSLRHEVFALLGEEFEEVLVCLQFG